MALTTPQGATDARILGVGGFRPSRIVTYAEIVDSQLSAAEAAA